VDLLSLDQAASSLGVTRRRVQALVERGQLKAQRVAGIWLVEAADVHQRRRSSAKRGRPVKASTAWRLISENVMPIDPSAQDTFRRQVLTRAEHREGYVHPSIIADLRLKTTLVFGGREAADDAGLPVGLLNDDLEVYLTDADFDALVAEHVVKFGAARPNLHLHVVADDAWPFLAHQRFVSLLVAWLDLADRGDRAERLIREQLLRGDRDRRSDH
jgi:excisionase family DNA binding protein